MPSILPACRLIFHASGTAPPTLPYAGDKCLLSVYRSLAFHGAPALFRQSQQRQRQDLNGADRTRLSYRHVRMPVSNIDWIKWWNYQRLWHQSSWKEPLWLASGKEIFLRPAFLEIPASSNIETSQQVSETPHQVFTFGCYSVRRLYWGWITGSSRMVCDAHNLIDIEPETPLNLSDRI